MCAALFLLHHILLYGVGHGDKSRRLGTLSLQAFSNIEYFGFMDPTYVGMG
jgi:hypothetical protein